MGKKKKYTLTVDFLTDKNNKLYEGISYYNSRIIDELLITEACIEISFQRSNDIDLEQYCFSYSNPIRYQLYRAACFYLAVAGEIPVVDRIVLSDEAGKKALLDKASIARNWDRCHIQVKLPIDVAARCLQNEGKQIYTVITYYLKAQLDSFSHDAFRAAWSCLNGVYSQLSYDTHENKRIAALRKCIRNNTLTTSQEYVENLSDDFWKHLQWYNYVSFKTIPEIKKMLIDSNLYSDHILYERLSAYMCGLIAKNEPEKASEYDRIIKMRIGKKNNNLNERVRFLITEYCYMLRNRSFHAASPYPVFGLINSDYISEEEHLTRLILLVVKDLLSLNVV